MSNSFVALFTRAWIEILTVIVPRLTALVALFTRAWIEIVSGVSLVKLHPSRPLYEGVD